MRESKKLSKKNKRVKSDIRLDSRRQNKPENHHNKKRKAKASAVNEKTASSSGNYTRTVTAVFDSTTLIWFNELMFDHIQNSTNPKDLFYIGLTDSISTSDTEVQNHNSDYRREFGAVPVDFSSFDPLADSAIVEVPNRVFGTRYNLTLRNSNGDEINDTFIQIFSQDTTINTADLNQTFSSLSEGLYLIKVSGIDSSFTIYRQVIKDTTKPKISSIQPLQRLHAPGNPLTVSFGADTLALRYLDNFKMDDSLLYEFVLPDSIINNGTDTLKQGKKYRLWSQFFPMPKLSIQFQSKSIEAPDSLFEENEFSYRLDTLIFSDNLRHTFKEFLKFNDGDSLTGNVNVIITVNDAAGNTFSDTLEYNVMTKKKEGFISNHIFNYPNPFPAGERTTFRYVLSDNITNGQLAIFDAAGDLIYYWDLTQNNLNTPGTHFIEWDGKNLFGRRLSTGVYFGYFEVEYESKRKREYSFLKIAINNR